MTIAPAARAAVDLDMAANCVVLVDTGSPIGWALIPRRRRTAWLARLRHRSLDARLAAGAPAESSRLLAERTTQLVNPSFRRRVARRWDALAVTARRRLPPVQVAAAEDIQKVADVLRGHNPVGASGVALAVTVFSIAARSVHRDAAGGTDIAAAAARTALAAM